VFGIVSTFRNRVYPCAVVGTTAGNIPNTCHAELFLACSERHNRTRVTGASTIPGTGGGGGQPFGVPVFAKKLEVGLKAFYGDGTGRFGSAQLADATASSGFDFSPNPLLAICVEGPLIGGHWLARWIGT